MFVAEPRRDATPLSMRLEGTSVRNVRVMAVQAEQRVEVTVTDTGCGIVCDGQVFEAFFRAWSVHFNGQPVERHGPYIDHERGAFLVAAGVTHPVGVHDISTRPQDGEHAAEVGQIVP